MQRLLIWDIDGTLIDCGGSGRRAMNETFRHFFEIDSGFEGVPMAGKLDAGILKSALEHHALLLDSMDPFFEAYGHILDRHLEEENTITCLPGVVPLLQRLNRLQCVEMVIVTGNNRHGAAIKLRHAGLLDFFRIGAYGDEAEDRSHLVTLAVDRAEAAFGHTYAAHEVYVIGDTPDDILAAKTAGYKQLAVATGSYGREALSVHNPTAILDSFVEIDRFMQLIEVN
jgi:phosphoglycolate phosphatase-like HAD superfamily hydrolase